MNGHLEVVKLLLQSHADVNVKKNVSTESLTESLSLLCKSGNCNIIFIVIAYRNENLNFWIIDCSPITN